MNIQKIFMPNKTLDSHLKIVEMSMKKLYDANGFITIPVYGIHKDDTLFLLEGSHRTHISLMNPDKYRIECLCISYEKAHKYIVAKRDKFEIMKIVDRTDKKTLDHIDGISFVGLIDYFRYYRHTGNIDVSNLYPLDPILNNIITIKPLS